MSPSMDILEPDVGYEPTARKMVYNENIPQEKKKHKIIWINVVLALVLHGIVFYGLYLSFTSAHILTSLQVIILHVVGLFGVTGGCHRLWSHRAYKATFPLRVLLMLCATLSFQGTIHQWARDHRAHHKYSDTHADPQNISNGFFFAHLGWLLVKKLPEVTEYGKKVELRDLLEDPVVKFQKKHIREMVMLIAIIIPTAVPMVLWGETFVNAFCLNFLRHFISLHAMLAVNSFAHTFGGKPYDRNIRPTDHILATLMAMGEGFHNYHHTFPWDYKASELGNYTFNYTTAFIDFFAKIGCAYDLRTTSEEIIKKRCLRTGDGSHEIWGWGDKDQHSEEVNDVIVKYKKLTKDM